jgi:lysophospholipase L1-like esterase
MSKSLKSAFYFILGITGGLIGLLLFWRSKMPVASIPETPAASPTPAGSVMSLAAPPVDPAIPLPTRTRNSLWRRVGRMYQIVAIVCLNTVILAILALIIANLLLPKQLTPQEQALLTGGEASRIGVNRLYSHTFNRAAYYFMSAGDVDKLLTAYDRLALAGHWQVHPWAGLTMRPFGSAFLNVDENGVRQGIPPALQQARQRPLIVWAFGGSTLFGWGLADNYTLPSQLQVALQERLAGRQVQVINLAVPAYNSSQEVALFVANLRRGKPDIAVFFDGLNDVWFSMNSNTQTMLVDSLASAWEAQISRYTQPIQQPWVQVNPSFPPYRLLRQVGIRLPAPGANVPVRYAMQGFYGKTEAEQLKMVIESYRTNRRMATAVGKEFGVQTYFFLQPAASTEYYAEFRADLVTRNDNPLFFDLTKVFDEGDHGDHILLLDDFHYSDYASKLLAERMAALIVESEPLATGR